MANDPCNIADDLKSALAYAYSIPGQLGLNKSAVYVRLTTYVSASRPGVFTSKTVTEVPLLIAGQNPGVSSLSTREVIWSNGRYTDTDLRIGPLVPSYFSACSGESGGTDLSAFLSPESPASNKQEIIFRVTGPPFTQPSGSFFKLKNREIDSGLSFNLILAANGQTRPNIP